MIGSLFGSSVILVEKVYKNRGLVLILVKIHYQSGMHFVFLLIFDTGCYFENTYKQWFEIENTHCVYNLYLNFVCQILSKVLDTCLVTTLMILVSLYLSNEPRHKKNYNFWDSIIFINSNILSFSKSSSSK